MRRITVGQVTDLKETWLSPNSTVDAHDITNVGADDAHNNSCDENIDYNDLQGTPSEASDDSKRDDTTDPYLGLASGQGHETMIEQSCLCPSPHR